MAGNETAEGWQSQSGATTAEGWRIQSRATSEGWLEISLERVATPQPGPNDVVIRVEAAPINPSTWGSSSASRT